MQKIWIPKSRQGGVSLAILTKAVSNGDEREHLNAYRCTHLINLGISECYPQIRILTTQVDHKYKSITPVHETSLVYISCMSEKYLKKPTIFNFRTSSVMTA